MNILLLLRTQDRHGDLTITLRGRLTCICPFNGLRDEATVEIVYVPALSLIELEAFAEYLRTFSDRKLSHEDATREILATLYDETEPRRLTVTTTWAPVEGIDCTVMAGDLPQPAVR